MANFAEINAKIAYFFDAPNVAPEKHRRDGGLSVLYLLRRELIDVGSGNSGA